MVDPNTNTPEADVPVDASTTEKGFSINGIRSRISERRSRREALADEARYDWAIQFVETEPRRLEFADYIGRLAAYYKDPDNAPDPGVLERDRTPEETLQELAVSRLLREKAKHIANEKKVVSLAGAAGHYDRKKTVEARDATADQARQDLRAGRISALQHDNQIRAAHNVVAVHPHRQNRAQGKVNRVSNKFDSHIDLRDSADNPGLAYAYLIIDDYESGDAWPEKSLRDIAKKHDRENVIGMRWTLMNGDKMLLAEKNDDGAFIVERYRNDQIVVRHKNILPRQLAEYFRDNIVGRDSIHYED
jgi:hypothetical protein